MKQNPTSPIQCKTITPRFLIAIALAFACLVFSSTTQATPPQPPPGPPFATPTPTPTATPTPTPTPSPTPAGEDLGDGNTAAENVEALLSLTTGSNNTATGWQSLYSNTEGTGNTATGFQALFASTGGFRNTATGFQALFANTTGSLNTATGYGALSSNTTGANNTATGLSALLSNTEGGANTATGVAALRSNTTGGNNTANGAYALLSNIDGSFNTATGLDALVHNITGNANTATGDSALSFNITGSGNIALGAQAGLNTTGDLNIDIGNFGVAGESSTIRIGRSDLQTRTFIAGIRGVTTGVADAVNVVIDSDGQLGTISSSRRFKNEIKPMNQASEAILGLKPVTFHYKSDRTGTAQFGLIAEEVAQVNPDLVVRDEKGEIYTVRYEAVNAMLLNEFLKEHKNVEAQSRRMQEQDATIADLKKGMDVLTAQLKEQASQIQKVSAQLEASKSAPQVVLNNQ